MKIKYIVTLSLTVTLIAQSAAETLKHVAQETLINNPEIQALRKNTKAYRKYVDEEEGGYYPTLTLDTYFEDKETVQSGNTTTQDGVNTQLKLEQTLFDGGLTGSKVSEADHNFRSNKIKNIERIETILQETIEAYIGVVKNEELTLLSKNNLDIHEDYLIVAQQSEDVSGDSLDRMQVESKLYSAKAKYVKLQNDRNEAKANLVKFYGKKLEGQICRPNIDPRRITTDLEKAITDAVASNYTILEALENIKSQRAVLSQEKSRFLPTVKARVMREVDDGVDVKNTKKTEDTIRLSLSYNLFNGFKDKATYERERLFLQESQKTLDNVVDGIKEEVKINFSKYHTAKDRIKFLKEYLEKNKNILNVYLEQFEGGTRSFIDILNHEAEIFRAKTELVEEEFTYYSAYFALLALQSRLSEAVIDNAEQICKPIKVDIEKRDLRAKDEGIDDDLTNLFNDDLPEPAQEVMDSKQQQDAEVQSILSQILDEIYSPDAKNRNINVSNHGSEQKEERYLPTHSKVTPKKLPTSTEKLIKERQLEEEKALREEAEVLKAQIKKETKKLLGEDEATVEKEKVERAEQTSIETTQEVKEAANAVVPEVKKEKTEIEKLLEERERLRKLAQNIDNEVKNGKSSSVVTKKKSWDEMTLKEQQDESRRLGAEIRRKYREKIAKEEAAKAEKLVQAKQSTLEKASEVQKQKEERVEKAKVEEEKTKALELEKSKKEQEAKRIKEEAIKKAKELALQREEELKKAKLAKAEETKNIQALEKQREDSLRKAAEERERQLREELEKAKRVEKEEQEKAEEIKRKEEEEAEKLKQEAEEKERQEALEKAQKEREKAQALAKQKEQEQKELLKRKEEEEAEKQRLEAEEKERQKALEKAQKEREKAQAIAKEREEAEKARLATEEKAQKEQAMLQQEAELLKQQAESRRVAAEIRRKFKEKIAKEEALKQEQEAAQAKAIKEQEAKAKAEALRIEKAKQEAKEAQKRKEAAIKRAQEIKAQQEEKRAKEQAAKNIVEEMAKTKAIKEKEEAQIARIKKEQEEAQLKLRQEAQLQEEKERAQKEKDEAARAKAKAIIEELRNQKSVEIKPEENIEVIDNREIKTLDDTVSKAQMIVDDIKRKKEQEQQLDKAQALAETMKNKESLNPIQDGSYFKIQKLVNQDDARQKAKAIVAEIKEKQTNTSDSDVATKAKAIVEAIKVNKTQADNNVEKQSSEQVVSKAKALVQEIKSQSSQKDETVKKAQDLISDIKAKKSDEIQEYRFNEDKTLEKEDNYISLKKEFITPNSKKYTISILTLDSNKNTKTIQQRYGLNEDVVSYKLMSNGKEYYKIIYGVFNTRDEALKAIAGLHPKLQDNKPFVDRISKHQKLYLKYNQ